MAPKGDISSKTRKHKRAAIKIQKESKNIKVRELEKALGGRTELATTPQAEGQSFEKAQENLTEVLGRYQTLKDTVRDFILEAHGHCETIGVEMTGSQVYTKWEKFLGYIPVKGDTWQKNHYKGRVKNAGIQHSYDMFYDILVAITQATEITKDDLVKERDAHRTLQKVLLQNQKTASEDKEVFKEAYEKFKLEKAELNAEKAGKTQTELLTLQERIDEVNNKMRDTLEAKNLRIYQMKCAAENYEFSEGFTAQTDNLIEVFKKQSMMLTSLIKDSKQNIKSLSKGLAAAKQAGLGAQAWDMYRQLMNKGLALYADTVGAASQATDAMMTEDTYDRDLIVQVMEDAAKVKELSAENMIIAEELYDQKYGPGALKKEIGGEDEDDLGSLGDYENILPELDDQQPALDNDFAASLLEDAAKEATAKPTPKYTGDDSNGGAAA